MLEFPHFPSSVDSAHLDVVCNPSFLGRKEVRVPISTAGFMGELWQG